MSVVNFLVITTIFIILLILNSFLRRYIKQIKNENKNIQNTLNEIKAKLNELKINNNHLQKQEIKQEPVILKNETQASPSVSIENIIKEQKKETLKLENSKIEQIPVQKKKSITKKPTEKQKKHITTPRKSFLKKHPDIEKFIGENLINKIGIIILVLGIGFFVKFAIDKNWINEIGRVAIGILSAGILIALAHKLRKEYKAFSSVLIGGGLAILYFTISLAFHTKGYPLYQQQTPAFIILIFITSFAVFLSIAYNRIEIAILAILGGFGSPFMVSNGAGNYIVLFSYITILNIGMLVLSYFKKWRLVNIIAFIFTVLLFALWLSNELINNRFNTFTGAIIFATEFYITFFLMNIIYNIKYKIKFKFLDISLILINTFAFFTFAMLILNNINNGAYKGLFSILLATFNFAFAFYIHKKQETDKNLLYLLIGLVFTFITLAIPLQLNGNYITLFWAIESILLLWLSQKSGFKIMKTGSFIVLFLMLISLIIDWSNNYDIIGFYSDNYVKKLNIVINSIFITTLISGSSLIATLYLLKSEKEKIAWFIPVKVYKYIILSITLITLFIGGLLEINYQTYHYFEKIYSRESAIFAYEAMFILITLIIAHKINKKAFSIVISSISTIFIIMFFTALSTIFAKSIHNYISDVELFPNYLLLFRWIAILFVYSISILLFKLIINILNNKKNLLFKAATTFFILTILYLLSADLDAISILITQNTDTLIYSQKTGYAILWGISSFILMIIGMKKKIKIIRILSLILFAITITKLFVYDISNISEGGKIVAFILLGVLLLIISFMYQKVKKLVIDDDFSQKSDKIENTDV